MEIIKQFGRRKSSKKGVYFTLDAFFATMLLMIGMVMITKFTFTEIDTQQIDMLSKDLLFSFGELEVNELNNSWVIDEINNGNITNINNSVIEQIASYWSRGDDAKAENLSRLMSTLVPDKYGFSIYIEGDEIYSKNKSGSVTNLITSRRMVTGIELGSPVEGSAASAILRKVRNKQTSSYAYFGGFFGQGNVSVFIDDLPTDIDNNTIQSITLEIDNANTFDFYVNDYLCNSSLPVSIYNMSPNIWDLSHCKNQIVYGRNNFSVIFPDADNSSYIAGGYVKITYITNETANTANSNQSTYYFPQIEGIINVYDGFYIPGTLDEMQIDLHYFSNHSVAGNFSTILSIGEVVVFNDSSSTSEQQITLNDTYLSNLLNYSFLGEKNVPVRMYSYEFTFEEVITGGNADIILITDYSGSMKKAVSDWDQGNAGGDCATAYASPDIRKTELAVCLDNDFVDIVMAYEGNRLWPVFLHNDEIKSFDDPENAADIKSYIDGFSQGRGKTCLSCAVNRGYDLLANYSNSSRNKFIVLMTDGMSTTCPAGGCTSNSSVYGTQQCEGLCDTAGACDADDVPSLCSECSSADGGINSTYLAINRSVQDMNVTTYTIGFGPIDDCSKANESLYNMASIGNGTYSHSDNVTELQMIYDTIAYDILERSNQVSQKVIISNETPVDSRLYESTISFNYTPTTSLFQPSEVSVVFQSEQFNSCSPSVEIPFGFRIADARITSYSDEHWTSLVTVNNNTVFNLQDFSDDYIQLGDPARIEIPVSYLVNGFNNFTIQTGDTPTNLTGCSDNNTLIYKGLINFSSARSDVVEFADGCVWNVEFEDNTFTNISIPDDYVGSNLCNYTNQAIVVNGELGYKNDDAYDVGFYGILRTLDFDEDGRILLNFESEDLEVVVNLVTGIPYMWGPSMVEVRMWQ